jgi:methyl-accepting chemotaxis protein
MLKLSEIFNWFYNLKTSTKLILIVVILAVSSMIMGIFSYISLMNINQQNQKVLITNVKGIVEMSRARVEIITIKNLAVDIVERGLTDQTSLIQNRLSLADGHIQTLKSAYGSLSSVDSLYESWTIIKKQLTEMGNSPDAFVQTPKGRQLINIITGLEGSNNNKIQAVEDDLSQLGIDGFAKTTQSAEIGSLVIGILLILSLILAAFLGFVTIRTISLPLRGLRQAMVRLSEGSLQLPNLPRASHDEIGETSKAYEESINKLRQMTLEVRQVTDLLTTMVSQVYPQVVSSGQASKAVSTTMSELNKGTQEQAKAADEMASTIHEVVERINRVNKETQVIANYSKTVIAETEQGDNETKLIMNHINNLA